MPNKNGKEKSPKLGGEVRPVIDYPQEGGWIGPGRYTVRIGAEPNSTVEVSINNGKWRRCRESVGYWWFDWNPTEEGTYKLSVRSRAGQGRWHKSEERSCKVAD